MQRHKKTEGCWVGGREDNGERARDLNEEDPRWISLPKAENGFDHVVCLQRLELNSRSRTQ